MDPDLKTNPAAILALLATEVSFNAAVEVPTSVPDLAPVLADSFGTSRELTTTEDAKEAQRLQGLYVNQISARLTRVLEELRAVTDTAASCLVNVVQDERGTVLDVLTDQCDADTTWRGTVEHTIRNASPLPLPPQGLAMGSYLTLDVSLSPAAISVQPALIQ